MKALGTRYVKSMCAHCERGPRQPHLDNCPALTGIAAKHTYRWHGEKTYLRRRRIELYLLPRAMYLVETKFSPDSPAAFYHEENKACPTPRTHAILVETKTPDPGTPAGMHAELEKEDCKPQYYHLANRK